MSNIINLYTIMGGIGLFISGYIFLKSKKNVDEAKNKAGEVYLIYKNDEKIRIALEAVSRINGEYDEFKEKKLKIKEKIEDVKNKGVNLEFEDISNYCQRKDRLGEKNFYYIPSNPYLKKFQEDVLLKSSYYTDKIAYVIDEILRLLDNNGNCSSVIKSELKEVIKSDQEKNTYELLSRIDLARHSVNVAMNMYKRYPDGIKMLKAVVIGLTHDLGKIPKYYKEYSGIGKHHVISTLVINKIQYFDKIGIFQDIKDIISKHHHSRDNKDDIMLLDLREADQEARKSELYYIDKEIESNSLNPLTVGLEKDKNTDTNEVEENKEDIEKNTNIKVSFSKDEIIIILKELLKYINIFDDNEKKFYAFTCPKMDIYFQPNLLFKIIGDIYPDKVKYIITPEDRKNVYISFIDTLREYYPTTVGNYIKKGYFGNHFTLYKKDDSEDFVFLMAITPSIYGEIGEEEAFNEAHNRRKDSIISDILSVKQGKRKKRLKEKIDPFDNEE